MFVNALTVSGSSKGVPLSNRRLHMPIGFFSDVADLQELAVQQTMPDTLLMPVWFWAESDNARTVFAPGYVTAL